MMQSSHLTGIDSSTVQTPRLKQHVLSCGDSDGEPVFFIHGNFSAADYFEALMLAMPEQYRSIAPDLRGYGDTEDKVIDARRGARDWSDDLVELMQALDITSAHFLGWSAGAAAIMQLAIDHPQCIRSLSLIAPVSPFGFGGSANLDGRPNYPDFAGCGGGTVAKEFIAQIQLQDTGDESDFSPRNIIRNSYFAKPWIMPREEQLLRASLKQKVAVDRYPGDFVESKNWPYVAPGRFGPINAISARHFNAQKLIEIASNPPILWLHGSEDKIISDQSYSDIAFLGSQNLAPGWPGDEICPPQPMVSQTRNLLEQYGNFKEICLKDVGHSPFIEAPEEFLAHFVGFLDSIPGR
ncbi:alpha/beta hydrolase [Pseudoteredinibacter isoporae]|uniref:Pimeloyl-ACP methyl ester carboxylesterase n=1 Tax=Pseudoteredinibacter isoporae TaxID=570281 RepID=A0A7X0JVH7_9GAMM|nr:alpha/beta hydrolase [Pseudoteredinibacter isoporae]MBB6523014.1 pimeloyl-ACP methyl ester carboxylesterase [Pseudoteredinibacter isoporae]NHO88536.1 alpha/beta hydrolase [Pseudoteredinibacter isoporae]NIB22773.1 alpha/beta hydrolase [Pseudoteredinibacter isoporae]